MPDDEVFFEQRGNRAGMSRLCRRPPAPTRLMTVIGGYSEGECVLFTAYGGVAAPREPWDPTLDETERQKSLEFWATHALSA